MELFKGFFIEINFKEKSGLLVSWSYNPHKNNISSQVKCLSQALDNLNATYENIILVGDFNVERNESNISDFLDLYNLKTS